MKDRRRIYYSAKQRAEIRDRWQRGESVSSIGRVFDRQSSSERCQTNLTTPKQIHNFVEWQHQTSLSISKRTWNHPLGGNVLRAVSAQLPASWKHLTWAWNRYLSWNSAILGKPIWCKVCKWNSEKRLGYHSNWQWHLDEVFVKINGERYYLWRAVIMKVKFWNASSQNGATKPRRRNFS